jgi:hypothetical protein
MSLKSIEKCLDEKITKETMLKNELALLYGTKLLLIGNKTL